MDFFVCWGGGIPALLSVVPGKEHKHRVKSGPVSLTFNPIVSSQVVYEVYVVVKYVFSDILGNKKNVYTDVNRSRF